MHEPSKNGKQSSAISKNIKKKEDVAAEETLAFVRKVTKRGLCHKCKKNKYVKKHHFPLGSARLVYLCTHCYEGLRNQRNRARTFGKPFTR